VKAGQLLAMIDTPSLDAQYAMSKANLHVAEANYRLAVSTAQRWQALAGTVAVSKQEVDVQVAGAAARQAELEAATQEVARYAALEAFKRVVAPFDGVVTARLTDVGSYVNAAGGDLSVRGSSTELFTVADVHKLRVFVAVPQNYADQLVTGITATLHLPSQPGTPIEAQFLTTARAFSDTTRTAVTELTVNGSNRSLWPGTYVEVEFEVPSDPKVLTIPEGALIFRAAGTQIAVVEDGNRAHLRNVTLGENLGAIVQITSGLTANDKLVNNPPAGLLEGQRVEPVIPAPGYALARQHLSEQAEPPPPRGAASGDGHATTP
jgi:RND family efflux transporter MFP subunit